MVVKRFKIKRFLRHLFIQGDRILLEFIMMCSLFKKPKITKLPRFVHFRVTSIPLFLMLLTFSISHSKTLPLSGYPPPFPHKTPGRTGGKKTIESGVFKSKTLWYWKLKFLKRFHSNPKFIWKSTIQVLLCFQNVRPNRK